MRGVKVEIRATHTSIVAGGLSSKLSPVFSVSPLCRSSLPLPSRARLRAILVFAALLCLFAATSAPTSAQVHFPGSGPRAADTEAVDTAAAEFTLLNKLNLYRLGNGVAPLELDTALAEIARLRCMDMIERNYFSHEIPGYGYAPYWILAQLNGAVGAGENLGISDEANAVFVDKLHESWELSSIHQVNLLRPEFSRIGIAVVEVPTAPPGFTLKVVAQVFAMASGPLTRV